MSAFWSGWIIILTTLTIIGTLWLLFGNRTRSDNPEAKTGHVYDGIEEYDNPLPAWWFTMFVASIVFAAGYLLAYPGMGNFPGLLNWTSQGQWERDLKKAEEKNAALYAQYAAMDMVTLAGDEKARKMGQRLFANNCSVCHGADARGSMGFPNLADADWLYGGTPENIHDSITHGRKGMMPAWGAVLKPAQVDNVVAYVASLSGKKEDPAAVTAGQSVYGTYCAACHGAEGNGNTLLGAPNLADNTWQYGGTAGDIKMTIMNGRNGNMPAHKDLLGEEKIRLLAAYVYGLPAAKP